MKKERLSTSNVMVLKIAALFAVVFTLALPITAKSCMASCGSYRVSVSPGYLALRNDPSYNPANEIGQLYTGDYVELSDSSNANYWYVYSAKCGKYGYVDKRYLISDNSVSTSCVNNTQTVHVNSGYLALRNAKAYDSSNEIGQLYTGDTVTVTDSSDGTYWYVYSAKLGKSGYVNRNYLTGSASYSTCKTVRVNSGYLALRNAKAYDASNEIGQLYTGDTVTVTDSSDGTYWYVYSAKLCKSGYVNKNYLY